MILDSRRVTPGATLGCDVCIVGSGAAGITIATELAGTEIQVIVLVGGGTWERARDRDLYRGSLTQGTAHEPLEENRRRGWGGTTTRWGGRCVPLDPIDFAPRPHVPHSGWPLRFEDVLPYYERANEVCEAGAYQYDAAEALPGRPPEMIGGFDSRDVVSTCLERWSPPTNFARRYGHEIGRASNVRVLMHAHALNVQLAPEGARVSSVRAAARPGAHFAVVADDFVLACGGLENARLLLASRDVARSGVGNAAGNVGRYYMSHFVGVLGAIRLRDPSRGVAFGFDRDRDGVYVRRRFWLTPEAQTRARIGNGVAYPHRPDIADVSHRSALLSSTHLAKIYASAFRRDGLRGGLRSLVTDRSPRRGHWQVVLHGLPGLLPEAARLGQQRWLARRRLPMVLGSPTGDRFPLAFQTEHMPNPGSSVSLGPACDAFGVPRLSVHVAFCDLDVETIVGLHEQIAGRLEASGVGYLEYGSADLRASVASLLTNFNSGAHHLGTTRMAENAARGVVDRDGRVFGVANLFVTGGSVFPTAGHANPTLTVVALALRLADHLRIRWRRPTADTASGVTRCSTER